MTGLPYGAVEYVKEWGCFLDPPLGRLGALPRLGDCCVELFSGLVQRIESPMYRQPGRQHAVEALKVNGDLRSGLRWRQPARIQLCAALSQPIHDDLRF